MNSQAIKLFLVRHGNTFEPDETCVQIGSQTDLSLAKKGREQAQAFADCLVVQGIKLATIYSGPLKRHKEAAEIVAGRFQLEVEENIEALNEIDFGLWEGLTAEEIATEWPEQQKAWQDEACWAEGIFKGSVQAKKKALEDWFNTLRENHQPGEPLVAFSSGGVIRYCYSFLHAEWRKYVRDKAVAQLKIGTGNFSEIHLYPGSLKIVAWNLDPSRSLGSVD